MNHRQTLLEIVRASPQPLGWYGIEIRLSMRGIVLEDNLMQLLDRLTTDGYLAHVQREGYPHGVYLLSESGKALLNSPSSSPPYHEPE